MTTTSPLSPAVRPSLCSHRVSDRLVPPTRGCLFLAGDGFLGDVANECDPSSPVSPFDLELENIFEDHGVSWQVIDEMQALELETCWQGWKAQPALSALQRFNGRKCALLLRDLASAANLPPL